ncbi:MAG: hypothetical protein NC338_03310 [Firmicutes bacterium]|nr:hypothetical protein [Bacillota bacterium]MCM1401839.1 hypothetical protein [Bacteroides sp.]MCM1477724.1 hypothetical protein [Bacteroides sp.]
MNRNTISSLALAVIILLMGACNSDTWDDLPSAISQFVSEYFPFGELQSYTEEGGREIVQIKKGATLTFDNSYEWIDVNGNGVVLPQQFLYDKLPDALYRYIESIEAQNSVYRVQRTASVITVDLFDSVLTYNQDTGEITYPAAQAKTA